VIPVALHAGGISASGITGTFFTGGTTMRALGLIVLSVLIPSTSLFAQGGNRMKKTFLVDGRNFGCDLVAFTPPAAMTMDTAAMNQATPENCSRQFYALLARGDVAGASQLSNDPEKVRAKFSRQMERLGEKEFRSMFANYFAGGASLKYVFSIPDHQMLVLHDKEMGMDMAQFYMVEKGVWKVEERESEGRNQLAKLFQALKDEEGSVKVP